MWVTIPAGELRAGHVMNYGGEPWLVVDVDDGVATVGNPVKRVLLDEWEQVWDASRARDMLAS